MAFFVLIPATSCDWTLAVLSRETLATLFVSVFYIKHKNDRPVLPSLSKPLRGDSAGPEIHTTCMFSLNLHTDFQRQGIVTLSAPSLSPLPYWRYTYKHLGWMAFHRVHKTHIPSIPVLTVQWKQPLYLHHKVHRITASLFSAEGPSEWKMNFTCEAQYVEWAVAPHATPAHCW